MEAGVSTQGFIQAQIWAPLTFRSQLGAGDKELEAFGADTDGRVSGTAGAANCSSFRCLCMGIFTTGRVFYSFILP